MSTPLLDDAWARTPAPARIHDCLLGGRDNFTADRAAAERMTAAAPWMPTAARINLQHGLRASAEMALQGIRQFIDIGTGFPPPAYSLPDARMPAPSVGAAARRVRPDVRVVYVDRDLVVRPHIDAVHDPHDGVRVVLGDLLEPKQLLADPDVSGFLAPDEPTAVMLHAVLHWIEDDSALCDALTVLRDWLPAGSGLSITHLTADFAPEEMGKAAAHCTAAGAPLRLRTREEIADLFGDWPLLDPGLVPTAQWDPLTMPGSEEPETSAAYAGAAFKPKDAEVR